MAKILLVQMEEAFPLPVTAQPRCCGKQLCFPFVCRIQLWKDAPNYTDDVQGSAFVVLSFRAGPQRAPFLPPGILLLFPDPSAWCYLGIYIPSVALSKYYSPQSHAGSSTQQKQPSQAL